MSTKSARYGSALLRLVAAPAVAAALAGCSLGAGLFGGGTPDPQLQNASPTSAEIAQQASTALPVIATECPEIKVRPGGQALTNYGGSRSQSVQALNYQAVIERQSRNCEVSNGQIVVDMGIAGRVMLGPSGTQTAVTLPIRFVVERDGVAIFSQLYNKPVTITPPAQSATFEHPVYDIAIPYLGGERITLWVGFDSAS